MFAFKPHAESKELDEAIASALRQLDNTPVASREYNEIMKQVEKLYGFKTLTRPKSVSPDTLAIVIGNLLGVLVIVGYERANVMTSKALTLVTKAVR